MKKNNRPPLPGPQFAEPLLSLVYVSSAVSELHAKEIEYLLGKARMRNLAHGVTGMLLYCDGNFMQYIEGPRPQLEFIYAIIRKDRQHHALIEIVREPIVAREFAGWSMAYRTPEIKGYAGATSEHNLLEASLQPPSFNPSAARILLHGFWNRAQKISGS